MPAPEIHHYRPPRARVAVAYSTKDRVDQTRTTSARLLDDPELDLFWFDGSATEAGRQLPLELCAGRPAVCAVHRGVVGGPDCAIMYALGCVRGLGYDLVILIENDVVLADGWLPALHASMERALDNGFKVGAATVRVYAQRVLSFNGDHCLMLNSGAGFIALTPVSIDLILGNYRTLDGVEFIRLFQAATGIDVSETIEFEAARRLSVDWFFDLILYVHGLVVAAPPVSFASTVDDPQRPSVRQVTDVEQHLPAVRTRLTRPCQVRDIPYKCFRFQKSPLSDRMLIGCHQLLAGVNRNNGDSPVRMHGHWRRVWLQGLGPFGLAGDDEISVATYGPTAGLLLFAREARAELLVLESGRSIVLEAGTMVDFPLEAGIVLGPPPPRTVLRVVSGQIVMIGLTAGGALLSEYANAHPSVDHLPL
jgi:hypothetical protein